MSSDSWQKLKEIFNSVLDLPDDRRGEYLAEICAGDADLRRKVEDLLHSYKTDFLEAAPVTTDDLNRPTFTRHFTCGDMIGRYEVISLIGSGGMGEVYLARDKKLDRKVAIKVLNEKYEKLEANIQRFIQEAKSASALSHPNILVIHEIGETDGSHFIVSEYVDGKTLRDILNERRLSISETLDIAAQVANALAAAHAARILHRDIKPENIVIRKDGYVKVLDFGLAKLIQTQPAFVGLEDKTIKQYTAQGMILGTVSYMSPEQAKGEPVDERTDLFSLGVVIYEMLTRRTPFGGKSMSETFANLINKEPIPLSQHTSVSDELQEFVSKSVEKERHKRFQTADDLLTVLGELRKRSDLHGEVERVFPEIVENDTGPLQKPTGNVGSPTNATRSVILRQRRSLTLGLLAVAVVGMVGFAWYWFTLAKPQAEIKSLAVLPLENLSGDSSQEYFADGMTEALISNLSQIKDLKVISRTSVMRFKGSREPLPDIAKALGVDAIIEGSVVKAGDRVRVTAQLIHAPTDANLWARNYERDLSDILRLQSDVAQAIANEVRAKLTPAEQKRLGSFRTIDPKAHEAYLLGKFYLSKNTEDARENSVRYLEQAIAIDPNYADAYAGLAAAWLSHGIWGQGKLADFEFRVRDAAIAAIRIDPSNANAHIAMCQLLVNYDYNWSGGEEEAKRALEIDPNSIEALEAYSWLLQSLGRHSEVRPLMERAVQLDPVSSRIHSAFGRMLYRARQYGEAEMHLLRSIELDPSNYSSYGRLGDVYIEIGRFDEALAQFDKGASIQPEGAHALRRAVVYARMGDRKKALDTIAGTSNRSPWEMARIYSALGEIDKVFEVFEEPTNKRDILLVHVKEDPSFVRLHSDLRWKPLLRRLNFPDV